MNTNLRRKLFGYVFTHVDEEFYVRNLASVIGVDAGNLSRELKKMEEEGVFESAAKGRSKFYKVNKKYHLYEEVKMIVFKTEGVQGSLRKIVNDISEIEVAFIYGSYASEKERKSSDVDLVVVGEFDQDKFTKTVRRLEDQLNREINFTIYNLNEFKKEILNDGGFLSMVVAKNIIMLKGSLDDKK
ncbi:MAG: nucleotidyltransferase domain-containing protein [Candidatus Omnitrophica bacterium]|nr:nucleotidyltransferase domain-containing protein [Candidatus Omnitrophota bacterium]MBU1995979.1 nucleotidyltransferase domain-containing protein [Candidatus Omnitrophota bacterium]MBU4333730.1 nucleotidyltransferase domain-containing protein [Candidatus Omnitrophota bacterium]